VFSRDDLFRRKVCILLTGGGFIFAVAVIVNNPTWVGVIGGVPGMASSGFAIASLAAAKKPDKVEYAWVALALLAFAIVAVIVAHWIWL
jgi:hypothetical protein